MDRPLSTTYPFSAIVGQDAMRLALLLNAINPAIGGVLIRGEKGTAKSTMARALADLLPAQLSVVGCRYNCVPPETCPDHAGRSDWTLIDRKVRVVELPNNATEDRVAGTLDIQAALQRGEKRFEPGLLAEANRGILYVDEVNLLGDHVVDLLLDAAAMGRNTVEREGVSFSHPARFILFGTMNPEEGDLRPQLLDRFGLCVDVEGLKDVASRVAVMTRRSAFEADPTSFAATYQADEDDLRRRVVQARALLPLVVADAEILRMIAAIAIDLDVDGHRADLVMLKTASTIAAYEGRETVTRDDVRRAAELALPHRMRRRPFEDSGQNQDRIQEALDNQDPPEGDAPGDQPSEPSDQPSELTDPPDDPPSRRSDPGQPLALPSIDLQRDRLARDTSGRRQQSVAGDTRGRVVRAAIPTAPTSDIALGATIRAAASHPAAAGAALAVSIEPADLRQNVRQTKVGADILFVVDASGSMGAKKRIEAAKGAAITLLTEAYQRRDRVGLIAFRAKGAELLLPITDSVETVHAQLRDLPTGGRTPLPAGLRKTSEVIRQLRLKSRNAVVIVVLITDGKANVALEGGAPIDESLALAAALAQPGVTTIVLDTEHDFLNFGLAQKLADAAHAQYVRLGDVSAAEVAASVRGAIG